MLNNLIDNKDNHNISYQKQLIKNFISRYSYYLIEKEELSVKTTLDIAEVVVSDAQIKEKLSSVDTFLTILEKYPSQEFIRIKEILLRKGYKYKHITIEDFSYYTKEYYNFFDDLLGVVKSFIEVTSTNGFLPSIKSNTIRKTIGFTNYQDFFNAIEELKQKGSEIGNKVTALNIFPVRRVALILLVTFYPYFTRKSIADEYIQNFSFDFLDDKETMLLIHRSTYEKPDSSLYKELNDKVITNLKSLILDVNKYISFEFGESEITPYKRQKFKTDPTNW